MLHEWLADHVSWVQYPDVRPASVRPFFKHEMPFATRAGLVLFGVITLMICAVALFFIALLAWSALTA